MQREEETKMTNEKKKIERQGAIAMKIEKIIHNVHRELREMLLSSHKYTTYLGYQRHMLVLQTWG